MRKVVYSFIMLGALAFLGIGVALAYISIAGGDGQASTAIDAPDLTPADPDAVIFRIDPQESQVRFVLDELLRGVPTTVVGATNQVAGDLAVDFDNPARSQVGVIRINVRTLETDQPLRNSALRATILQSNRDEYEFAQFVPVEISGLAEQIVVGEPVEFEIRGHLTVRDVTRPVTFTATVMPVSEARLEGTASAVVQRGDFGLIIPEVPGVANVSEDVRLEIDFVAEA